MRASPEAGALRAFVARCRTRLTIAAALDAATIAIAGACLVLAASWWMTWPWLPMVAGSWTLIAAAAAVAATKAARATRVVEAIETRAPACRNVVFTASELLSDPERVKPAVGELVVRHAARSVAALDPRRLFSVTAPLGRLMAAMLIYTAGALAIARWPFAAAPLAAAEVSIDKVIVVVTPPDYTHRPPVSSINPPDVRVLAGSSIQLRVAAAADSVVIETVEGRRAMARVSEGQFSGQLRADREGFIAVIAPGRRGAPDARRLIGLAIDTDRPPVVRVTKPGRDIFTARGEPLPIEIVADDDIGLASLTVTYTTVTGSGENFEFHQGDVPLHVTKDGDRRWTAAGMLDVASLHLAAGDTVAYRGVARDTRPGGAPVESDTFIVQIVTPDRAALGGFAADDEMNKYALSEQMIIIKTGQLLARRSAMSAPAYADEAANIGSEQRRLRAQFVFMMGGELDDAAAAPQLDETNEAAKEEDIAAGRLRNRGYADVVQATRRMGAAAAALIVPDAPAALTEEKAALAALQQAFTKDRYLLRSLSTQEQLDESRRLSGRIEGLAGGARPAAMPEPLTLDAALRRALAGVATLAGSTDAPDARSRRAEALSQAVLQTSPASSAIQAISRSLGDAARAFGQRHETTAARALDAAAFGLAAEIRKASAPAPAIANPGASRLNGALADILRRQRSPQ